MAKSVPPYAGSRNKKTAISRYVNHGKNASATLFRIILDSRIMMTSKTEILLLLSGAANDLVFPGFSKLSGTMR